MTKTEFEDFYKLLRNSIKGTKYENHTYFTGECVQNFLLNKDVNRIEIVITLVGGGISFANWITMKYQCLMLSQNPKIFTNSGTGYFKLTTLDKYKHILISSRIPKSNVVVPYIYENRDKPLGSIKEDASCADLTIDSIYLDVSNGTIIDPYDGVNDLANKRLKAINPNTLFDKHPINMLKVIRKSSENEWGIEKETWLNIIKHQQNIQKVDDNSIKSEFEKILLANKPSYGLNKLLNSGLLYHIFPQLYCLNRLLETNIKNETVFEHTIKVVDETQPRLANRMSALFHDIGKPLTLKLNGRFVSYPNHEKTSAEVTKRLLSDLDYPTDLIEEVCCAIVQHHKFANNNTTPSNRLVRQFLDEITKYESTVLDLMKSNAKCQIGYSPLLSFERIQKTINNVKENAVQAQLIPPITAQEIMSQLNVKNGHTIGKIIQQIKTAMYSTPNLTKEQAWEIAKNQVKKTS